MEEETGGGEWAAQYCLLLLGPVARGGSTRAGLVLTRAAREWKTRRYSGRPRGIRTPQRAPRVAGSHGQPTMHARRRVSKRVGRGEAAGGKSLANWTLWHNALIPKPSSRILRGLQRRRWTTRIPDLLLFRVQTFVVALISMFAGQLHLLRGDLCQIVLRLFRTHPSGPPSEASLHLSLVCFTTTRSVSSRPRDCMVARSLLPVEPMVYLANYDTNIPTVSWSQPCAAETKRSQFSERGSFN